MRTAQVAMNGAVEAARADGGAGTSGGSAGTGGNAGDGKVDIFTTNERGTFLQIQQ